LAKYDENFISNRSLYLMEFIEKKNIKIDQMKRSDILFEMRNVFKQCIDRHIKRENRRRED